VFTTKRSCFIVVIKNLKNLKLLEDSFIHMDPLLNIKEERLIIIVVIELQIMMAVISFDYQT